MTGTILICASEGEWAQHAHALDSVGADDKRRGSTRLTIGDQLFRDFEGTADMWFHLRIAAQTNVFENFGEPRDFVVIRNALGEKLVALRDDDADLSPTWGFHLGVASDNAGSIQYGAQAYTSPAPGYDQTTFADIDIHVVIAGNLLTVTLWKDGVRKEVVNRVQSGAWQLPGALVIEWKQTDPDRDDVFVQDVIVTDGIPTLGMELVTMVPAAQGHYDAFNNDFENVNAPGYDPDTAIHASAPGDAESWVLDVPEYGTANKSVFGVALNNVAQSNPAKGIDDFAAFVRIGGDDYGQRIGASDESLRSRVTLFLDNPSTGAPWNHDDLPGLEAGVRACR